MSTIRVEKNSNYQTISNVVLQDQRLSIKAKGMLTYILQLPDTWQHSVRGYAKVLKEGEGAINAALRELEQYGYVTREQTRDEAGRLGRYVYTIYEVPQTGQTRDKSLQKQKTPCAGTIRVIKNRNYTTISVAHMQDQRLTLQAKGMLTYVLHLPDTWKHSVRGYAQVLREGESAINAALRELEQYGYVTREQTRDEAGRLGECIYTIYEVPQTGHAHEKSMQKQKSPCAENPCAENPCAENPCAENPRQLITNIIPKTKKPTPKKSIHLSQIPAHKRAKRQDMEDRQMDAPCDLEDYNATLARVQERIDCDVLAQEYGQNAYVCAEVIAEVLCNDGAVYYAIEGQNCPADMIRARYVRLRSTDVIDVLDALRDGGYKPRNPKAYLRTALYNAAATPLL